MSDRLSMALAHRTSVKPTRGDVGFTLHTTPSGRQLTVIHAPATHAKTQAQSVAEAQWVAKRMIALGNKLKKQVAHTKVNAPVAPSKKHGLVSLSKLADDLIKSGNEHIDRAAKHGALVDADRHRIEYGTAAARRGMQPHGGHSVHGDYDVTRVEGYRQLAQLLGSNVMPGSINAATSSAAANVNLPGPDKNYGAGPAPTLADAKKAFYAQGTVEVPDGDSRPYPPMPADAIPYDWSTPPGFKDVGSYTTYYLSWPGSGIPAGSREGGGSDHPGFSWHGDNGSAWWVYWPIVDGRTNPSPTNPPSAQEAASTDAMYDRSIARDRNWGPLIGNPQGPFSGLRYGPASNGTRTWFWYRSAAPDWAIKPYIDKQLSQMMLDRQSQIAAAKQNYVAAVAQEVLDEQQAAQVAKQQAQEDAQAQQDASNAQIQQAQQQAQAEQQQQQAQDADAKRQQQLATQQHQIDQQTQALVQQANSQIDNSQVDNNQSESQVNDGSVFVEPDAPRGREDRDDASRDDIENDRSLLL